MTEPGAPSAPAPELAAESLVAIAERANARRSFLLVSRVLGKHLPLDAARCRLAGAALGLAVAGDPRAADAARALRSGQDAAELAAGLQQAPASMPGAAVIGFAETATGLGEQVAGALDAAWFQTTTRQHAACRQPLAFEEVHSHAPGQWFDAPRAGWPDGDVVLVDDELTTGATAARLIEVLHDARPARRYVIAALVDGRGGGEDALTRCSGRLGVPIEVVALERRGRPAETTAGWSGGRLPEPVAAAGGAASEIRDITLGFDGPFQHQGQDRAQRRSLAGAVSEAVAQVGPLPAGSLVLGTGEHLAFAQRHALEAGALTSSTTRSPVLVASGDGYPIRHGLRFPNPDDHAVAGYAYNVAEHDRPAIVVHFQDGAHRVRGQQLLELLAAGCPGPVTAVTCAA